MIPVWDPLVRLLHAALAAGIVLGWLTTLLPPGTLGVSHEAAGYAALAVVVVRIAWGLVGPTRARLASFVRGPRATGRYARLVLAGREPRHVGHNPLGGWMVLAFFAVVVALAVSGWLYRSDRFWGDETVERVHVVLAWAAVVLAVLHVAGVGLASLRQRENLAWAMVSGKKRAPRGSDID